MELRDTLKDRAYFETYLEKQREGLDEFQTGLDDHEYAEDRILPIKRYMHNSKYEMLIAKYSAGYPLEEIKDEYLKVLKSMLVYSKDDPELSRRLNMVSIGIMLEIDDEHFNALAQFIEETGEKEYMFDYLIHWRKPEWEISEKVRFKSVFGWIKEVSQMDKAEAEAFLSKYLKTKWYRTHRDFYWYDRHNNKFNVYSGYWCFEAGAIVKIMGLDDSSLKENQYYPYDMAHYKD